MLGNDFRITIIAAAKGVEVFILDDRFAFAHSLTFAPANIGGDGFTFSLGEGAHHGDEDLTI